jgi:hypothetical protein
MPATQQLHDLLDQVPESDLPAVHRLLLVYNADPVLYSLLTAPPDDEPYSDDQRARDTETIAAIDRGDPSLTSEELARQLGL